VNPRLKSGDRQKNPGLIMDQIPAESFTIVVNGLEECAELAFGRFMSVMNVLIPDIIPDFIEDAGTD